MLLFQGGIIVDKEYEEALIKKFFKKRIQDRFIFELSSPKKRSTALGRLSHGHSNVLIEKYLIEIPTPNSYYIETAKLLREYGAGEFCYSLSFHIGIDGKHLPLLDVLEKAVGYGLPSFISCIPGKLAYFEAEQSYGPPERFIVLVNN